MAVKPWFGAIKEPKRAENPHDEDVALDEALRKLALHHKSLTIRNQGEFPVGRDERVLEGQEKQNFSEDVAQVSESIVTARKHLHNILPSRAENSGAQATMQCNSSGFMDTEVTTFGEPCLREASS